MGPGRGKLLINSMKNTARELVNASDRPGSNQNHKKIHMSSDICVRYLYLYLYTKGPRDPRGNSERGPRGPREILKGAPGAIN